MLRAEACIVWASSEMIVWHWLAGWEEACQVLELPNEEQQNFFSEVGHACILVSKPGNFADSSRSLLF